MLNFKTFLCVFLGGLILVLSACSETSTSYIPAHNWKMSVVTTEDSAWAKGAHMFADLVKQRTGGKIQITVYPNSSLAGGDQLKELNMLQDGSIDFSYHSNLLYANLDPSFAAISMPWMFSNYSQVDAALSGPAGMELLKATESLGIVGLAYGENGFRQLTNNKRVISTPEDLRDMTIRIPNVELYKSVYKALGANPIIMNFSEVIDALRSGQVDGEENPIDIIVSSKIYDVQKFITIWNYSYDAVILGINRADWDGLPASAQGIIKQAAKEASEEEVKLSRQAAENQLSLLRDKGMIVTDLTTDQIEAFRAATNSVYAEWYAKIGPILNKFQTK